MGNIVGDKHGGIMISFDNSHAYSGDTVTGNIYVDMLRPFECTTLELTIEVQEYSRFYKDVHVNKPVTTTHVSSYPHASPNTQLKLESNISNNGHGNSSSVSMKIGGNVNSQTHTSTVTTNVTTIEKQLCQAFRTLFKNSFIVSQMQTNFMGLGQYSYPFSFVLPNHLPGSFEYYDIENSAYIKYVVSARLISSYGLLHDISTSSILIVRQQIDNFNYPKRLTDTQTIRSWCFFNKGVSTLNLSYPKNHYCPGEKVEVECEIQNTMCSVAATGITIELFQSITLKAHGDVKYLSRTISSTQNSIFVVNFNCLFRDQERWKKKY